MEQEKKYNNKDEEIDFLELLQTVWSGRKTLVKFTIIFGLLGLFIAVFSPIEYTASTTVVPQTSRSNAGSLGGLAAMAGVNLGGRSTEGIPPTLYPKVVQSIPFQKELLKVSLKFSDLDKEVTYQEYYKRYKKNNLLSILKSYTIGLPCKLLNLLKKEDKDLLLPLPLKDSIYRISIEEKKLFDQLQKQLTVTNNNKEGFVQISFKMPEALPAAQMTKKAQKLLQKAITDFKIQKAEEEFRFIEQRCKEARADFTNKQAVLASFRDRNQSLITSRSQSRLERLKSGYNLSFNIYSELAKQLETQKLKLKENTPVFTIIDPVSVPIAKSKPRRLRILITWLFLGIILGVMKILGKEFISKLRL